jgi:hypothetical protein
LQQLLWSFIKMIVFLNLFLNLSLQSLQFEVKVAHAN